MTSTVPWLLENRAGVLSETFLKCESKSDSMLAFPGMSRASAKCHI